MGIHAITAAFAYVDLVDLTGASEDIKLACTAEQRQCTNMRSGGWHEYKNTTKTSAFDTMSFWSSDSALDLDAQTFANLGVGSQVITSGNIETEGETCYFMRGMTPSYTWLEGNVGDLAKARVQAVGSDGGIGLIRGKLAHEYDTVSATGAAGTALNLGAVSATQRLYATLHIFGTPGTTITAVVESDADNTWASPTTRIAFGAQTTAGGKWGTPTSGAITDTWFRLNVTAITGTFTIAAAIGIKRIGG